MRLIWFALLSCPAAFGLLSATDRWSREELKKPYSELFLNFYFSFWIEEDLSLHSPAKCWDSLHIWSPEPLSDSHCPLTPNQFFVRSSDWYWDCDLCWFAVRNVRGWQGSLRMKVTTNRWELSHSLSLWIVLRYSTVVVLVVEVVVVVVLEIVSASSQQLPVSQSVSQSTCGCPTFLSFLTDRLTDCPPLPYSSVMSRWGLICLIMRLLDIKKTNQKNRHKMYKKKN